MVNAVPSAPHSHTVLLVDDDDGVRAFVRKRLEASNVVVIEAETGEEALKLMDADVDVVILDIGLTGIDGFTVLRLLREKFDTPVIIVSANEAEADRVLALEIGADDYVVKPFLPRELIARVHVHLRRSAQRLVRTVAEHYVTFGDVVLDGHSMEARRNGFALSLTNKEFDLLLFLASSPRQVFSRDQLLRQVWHTEPGWQDSSTVTEHVHRLRRLVEPDPAVPRHLVTVRGVGYRLDP